MFGTGACGGGPGRFMGPPHLMRHGVGGEHAGKCGPGAFLHGLDLSDEQVDRIAEIKAKSFSKLAHAKIDLFELRKQVFRELSNATIDRKKIDSIVAQIKEQKSQLADLMIGNMVALAETLTPEQRKKARQNKIRHFLGLEEGTPEEDA